MSSGRKETPFKRGWSKTGTRIAYLELINCKIISALLKVNNVLRLKK
jgi:hypothetical protein